MKVQKVFVDKLLDLYQNKPLKRLQADIAEIIGSNSMTVYNKISRRTNFTLAEVVQIADRFNLSLDGILLEKNNNRVDFSLPGLNNNTNSYAEYIEWLREIQKSTIQNGQMQHTYLVLGQPSLFHLAKYPYLFYLKLFSYNLLKWNDHSRYNFDPISFLNEKSTMASLESLAQMFKSVKRTEIISGFYIDKLVSQVNYLVQSGYLKDDYVIKQYKQELLSLIEKFDDVVVDADGNIIVDAYLNKFINVSNMTLVKYNSGYAFSVQADVPDVLLSNDDVLGEHMYKWMMNLQENSTKISRSGTVERRAWMSQLVAMVKAGM